jgi:hypothetical protein
VAFDRHQAIELQIVFRKSYRDNTACLDGSHFSVAGQIGNGCISLHCLTADRQHAALNMTPSDPRSATSVTPVSFRGRVLGGLTTAFFLGQFISLILSQPLSSVVGLGVTYRLAGGLMAGMGAIALGLGWRWR